MWSGGAPARQTAAQRSSAPLHRLLLVLGLASGCGSEDAAEPAGEPAYTRLSQTGLYEDLASRALAPGVRRFEPAFQLWSDGAEKARWIALPEGSTIDTSDMNRWSFPPGTRLWKEFSRGGTPLETRLIERYGSEPTDYWMGSFVWEADGSEAVLSEAGADDVLGTEHDAPARDRCPACHNGEPGRVLGFSALQLATGADLDVGALVADGWLSSPPAAGDRFALPDDAGSAAALGYLHGNCGSCHNPRGTAWPDTQMLLRIDIEAGSAETRPVLDSLVGQRLQYYRAEDGAIALRVAPGHPESSGVIARMQVRGPMEQMPPLATERVDTDGVDRVSRWIASLPE